MSKIELWLWSDKYPDHTGDQELLWFGLFADRRTIEQLRNSIEDEFKSVVWTTEPVAPDFQQAISEPESGRSYLGLYQNFQNGETLDEYRRRCMLFIERVSRALIGADPKLAVDLARIRNEKGLSSTEKKRLILARLGQGQYRTALLERWNGACAVTGSTVLEAIRASHVKPWRACSDVERLSPENGLPLIATLDALFDAGLVTFGNDGRMQLSPQLAKRQKDELDSIGVVNDASLRRELIERELAFLSHHRQHVFRS